MGLNKQMWEIKLALKKIRKGTDGFKFKYISLNDVEKNLRPLLVESNVGYKFRLFEKEGLNVLELSVFDVSDDSNEELHRLVIPKNAQLSGMNEYQALGSGITYFRRYLLVTAFGIIADDDVDAMKPKSVVAKPVEVDHLAKIKQLISIGRAKATLEKYYTMNQDKMSDAQKNEVIKLIKTQ